VCHCHEHKLTALHVNRPAQNAALNAEATLLWKCNTVYHAAIFVKPQQWPTPSESIAIYCVRKLVSCIPHLQSCAKVDIWKKKKKLRTVAKIKPQGYKNCRLPKFSTNVTPPLYTATTLFNEPRSQRPFGTSDWQKYSSRLAWLLSGLVFFKLTPIVQSSETAHIRSRASARPLLAFFNSKLRLFAVEHQRRALITTVNFCENGKFAVCGTYDGRCLFYDTEVGAC